MCFAGLLTLGSLAIVVSAGAQDVQFERIGEKGIDAMDLDFDSGGQLWAMGLELFRLTPDGLAWIEVNDQAGLGQHLVALTPDTLFSGSNFSVGRSIDGGEAFFGVHSEGGVIVVFDDAGPNNGLVLCGEHFGGSGIAYSTDRGATFTESVFTVVPSSRPTMETAVEIPDGPSAGRLVAGVFAGVVVSEDGGQTWSPSSLFQNARFSVQRIEIGIHPTSGNRRLYAAVLDAQEPDAQLYVSDDDGMTWTSIYTFEWSFYLAAVPQPPDGDGSLLAMTGADGLVFRSSDGGMSWVEVGQVPFPFTAHAANDMLIGPDGRLYVAVGRAGPERAWVYRSTEPVVVANEPPPEVPEESTALRVYPNPATDFITVESDAEAVEILDVLGRIVMTVHSNEQIDTSRLPVGIYVITAGSQSQRFSVVR